MFEDIDEIVYPHACGCIEMVWTVSGGIRSRFAKRCKYHDIITLGGKGK